MRSVYYYLIPVVLILLLAVFGLFQLYRSRVKPKSIPTPAPIASPPVGFFATPIPSPSPSPVLGTNTPSTQPSAGSDTVDIKDIGIFLEKPQINSSIKSPVTVSGKANVFEGHLLIRIKDLNGNVIGNGSATACMGAEACAFETKVNYSNPQTPTGIIEVFSPSPVGDGSEDYKQSIIVRF